MNLFADLALSQLITEPTHKSGNTLDILLTDYPELINNIKIFPPGTFVSSDHSLICFYVQYFIKRSKPKKRNIFNFKRSNWVGLNNDLSRVDWHYLLDNSEPDIAWNTFRNKFLGLCDRHIPKISIKESFQPPWFDSEVFRLNKKKEQFRKLFRDTKNQQHYKRFSSLRKKLKNLVKEKIRSNFNDDLAPNTITKKFWSSFRSASKSSRIPEKMFLDGVIRNDPEDIANLFNHMKLILTLVMIHSLILSLMKRPSIIFLNKQTQIKVKALTI